jgi:hypothetical protein
MDALSLAGLGSGGYELVPAGQAEDARVLDHQQALDCIRASVLRGDLDLGRVRVFVSRFAGGWVSSRTTPEIWSEIEVALRSGRVRVVERPHLVVDYSHGLAHQSQQAHHPTPGSEPIVDDNRALFIVRCDPELRDDEALRFEYLIRGLQGRAARLVIRSAKFPGEVVHVRDLQPDETRDGVHPMSWDGIVTTAGAHHGARLSPVFGPCSVEVRHDDIYRDDAPFEIPRAVMVLALDGFFHTSSALYLPSRPARGGPVETRRFPNGLLEDWHESSWFESIPFLDEPFAPPGDGERRDTVGLRLLADILDECGGPHATRRLLLCGHADAAGKDTYNDDLSAARAQCVWAISCGDAESFTAATDQFHVTEDNYVLLRYCAQRFFWSCDPGEPRPTATNRYREAVRCFQREYNARFEGTLEVDGKVGEQTRKAFFAIYESVLTAAFGGEAELAAYRNRLRSNVHGSRAFLACGERYGAARNPTLSGRDDRRVEALLFLPDDPVPEDAADIYAQANYQFERWTVATSSAAADGGSTSNVVHQGEYREATPIAPLPSHAPSDPDDPWDFLNNFRSAVNQALHFLAGEE